MEQKIASLEEFEQTILEMPAGAVRKELTIYDYGVMNTNKLKYSILNGTSPLLPKEGFIDLKGAYDIRTNTLHSGISQIMLLERQFELEAPTGAFVSFNAIREAQINRVDCAVRKGEHGFDILVQKSLNDITIEKWFNISQIVNLENLKKFLDDRKNLELDTVSSKRKQKQSNTKIRKINFTSPETYIGQVLAAISTGTKLLVTPEQEKTFKESLINYLNREHKIGKKDKLAIFKLASKANTSCQNTIKGIIAQEREAERYSMSR